MLETQNTYKLNNVAYLRYAGCCWGNYFSTELASLTGCSGLGIVSAGDLKYGNLEFVMVKNIKKEKLINYTYRITLNPVRNSSSVKTNTISPHAVRYAN
jgi:hypothetical protein